MSNLNKLVKQKAEANKNQGRDKSLPKIVEHKELKQVLDIELQYIHENKGQPRKEYDENKLKELAESIQQKGLIQPIVVSEQGNRFFIIIAGHRRFRAYKLLGKTSIPCVVDIFSTNQDDLSEKALVENLQRENLKASEIAETIYTLKKKEKNIDDLIKITGYKRASIFNYQKAHKMVLDGSLTKEKLDHHGIKILQSKNESLTVRPSDFKHKKPKKEVLKVVIEDPLNVKHWKEAKKIWEGHLITIKGMINQLR